jgi:hypothetical protein
MKENTKMVSLFEKSIMKLRRRNHLVFLDGGCNPEVAFVNGEIYSCIGNRLSDEILVIERNSVVYIGPKEILTRKNSDEILEIILMDLTKENIHVTLTLDI